MKKGNLLAALIGILTVLFVVMGTIWPIPSAIAYAGGGFVASIFHAGSRRYEAGDDIRLRAWEDAYANLGNKSQFTEPEFVHDLTGYYPSLRTDATLESFEVLPLHASETEVEIRLRLNWSTVVGTFTSIRDLHVTKNGNHWDVSWPLVKEPIIPPQVIAVNYLRWDVIYRGPGDDWGSQDVDAPHVRIVDMHPVQRATGVVVLGELLNEDVVPAYVSVKATLQSKSGLPIAIEDSFDKISPILLPKQVTPFLINFPNASLSEVGSIHMEPTSALVSASADPVIEIQDQKINAAPDASLTGQLVNQSGQVVNVAHVLGTFYNVTGQVVWVADQYTDRALLPQAPVPFNIHIPEDLARQISSERTVTATYSVGGFQ